MLPLTAALLFTAACSKNADAFTRGNVEVWSTYNTTKVMRDKHDYKKFDGKLSAEMGRGETEGAQLILTPDYNVRSYELKLSDLTCGDEVFPKENIKVFKQGYVNVEVKTYNQKNEDYPAGWIPDMLLPIEIAEAHGENTIESGRNQGLTVEFTSDAQMKAGTYEGSFSLYVDGEETEIPVSVQVWDIDVSKIYGKSHFGFGNESIIRGELSNDKETMESLYELLLNYRISPGNFPTTSVSSVEDFVEGYKKWSKHKNFASFGINAARGASSNVPNVNLMYQILRGLAELATPDDIVFDKAYIYVIPIDEPHTDEAFAGVKNYRDAIDSLEERIVSELETEGFFSSFTEKGYTAEQVQAFEDSFKEAFLNLPQIITTPYNSVLKNEVNTYCPPIQYYDTQYQREQYAKNADVNHSEQWFYTCMQPIYPYPSFHIDDYLIGARIQKWMQAAYNVTGYLYWRAIAYSNGSLPDVLVDPYTSPDRYRFNTVQQFAGEGYFTYPGYGYGEKQSFGSLRLAAYRDGQEDFDMIHAFDALLDTYESYYNASFEANDCLQSEYDKIFTGALYNSDDETFYQTRRITADLYEKAASEAKFVLGKSEIASNKATTNIYLAKGYKLKVNGKELTEKSASGEGNKFTIVTDLLRESADYSLEVLNAENESVLTYHRFVSNKVLSGTLTAEKISVSENSTVSAAGSGVTIDLFSRGEGYSQTEQLKFTPTITIDGSVFDEKLYKMKNVRFALENKSAYDLEFEVWLANDRSKYKYGKLQIGANAAREFEIENVYNLDWSSLQSANKIILTFANSDSEKTPYPVRRLSITSISCTLH